MPSMLAAMTTGPWSTSLGLLVLRCIVGFVMVAHGYNHIFGGGKIKGTAGWFESLGMKPGIVHAWAASVTEFGAGLLLMAGLLTPLAAAGVIGVMVVALVTNHLKNGFFIFRPGEGYEYVVTLLLGAVAIGCTGPGAWSLDAHLKVVTNLSPLSQVALTIVPGVVGALVLLAACWRPVKR